MLYSMTGYGAAEAQVDETIYKVELRSLNSKVLDLNIKMPLHLKSYEGGLRTLLAELLRGKVDVIISEEKNLSEKSSSRLNVPLMHHYHQQIQQFMVESGIENQNVLQAILGLPNVIEEDTGDLDIEKIKSALAQALVEAMRKLTDFRKTEGVSQLEDLKNRLQDIEQSISEIQKYEPERIERVKQRIEQELKNLPSDIQVDAGRLEAELIFYIERLDINEEKVRLKAHIEHFREVMLDESQIEKGKKLTFITQEMGREVNTIGSKANHAEIQKLVVLMKDSIEKIKEQSYNIL